MAPILAYWDIRGRAGCLRNLLHHVHERFEDKRYQDFEEWFKKDKPALEGILDFPNIPYFIDGKFQISQTKAILAYLGRKHNLAPVTDEELIRMHMAMEVADDSFQGLARIAYPPECAADRNAIFEELRKEYEKTLSTKFTQLSNFLGTNKWVAGDRLTFGDFYVYEVLDFNRILFNPKHVEGDSNILAYLKRFEELSGVKEFMASSDYIRLPIYAPFALFGHSKDYKWQ